MILQRKKIREFSEGDIVKIKDSFHKNNALLKVSPKKYHLLKSGALNALFVRSMSSVFGKDIIEVAVLQHDRHLQVACGGKNARIDHIKARNYLSMSKYGSIFIDKKVVELVEFLNKEDSVPYLRGKQNLINDTPVTGDSSIFDYIYYRK